MSKSNSMMDLNDILFDQLQRLADDKLSDSDIDKEIKRTESVVKVASVIIQNHSNAIHVLKLKDSAVDANLTMPKMLE